MRNFLDYLPPANVASRPKKFEDAEAEDLLPPIPEGWDADLRKGLADALKLTCVRRALEILNETANEMALALAAGADFTTEQGMKLALAKQSKMKGLQQAVQLFCELAEPIEEEETEEDV